MNIDELLLQKQLPTIPAIAMRILRLVDDVRSTSTDLANEIKHDPAMSAQLLRMANSSRYSTSRDVSSVDMAVTRLGRSIVASVALTFSLRQYVETTGALREEFKRYWRSTVLQAVSAELLAGSDSRKAAEYAMIGLMADIGRLAMICILRRQYTDVLADARKAGQRLDEAEEAAFGFNHATVSCRLAELWGLPDSLVEAIRLQHAGVADITNRPNVSAIHAVAPIASHISEMFENSALPSAAIAVDCLAAQFGSMNAEQLLRATRQRVGELQHVFNINADSLPPVIDVMANANRQLAQLLVELTDQQRPEVAATGESMEASTALDLVTQPAPPSITNSTCSVNQYVVLSQYEFEECATPYIASCYSSGGSVGMLLIQCQAQGICEDRKEEDRFVRRVRDVVRSSMRPEDLVARFASQFLYVLCRLDHVDELQFIADRLQSQLVSSFGTGNLFPSRIGGVAVDRSTTVTLDQLQQLAFFRLDQARQNEITGIDISIQRRVETGPPATKNLAAI